MWALRRAANHLRVRGGCGNNALRASANLLESSKCNVVQESKRANGEGLAQSDIYIIARSISYGSNVGLVQAGHGFASRAGVKKEDDKNEGKDDVGGLSELDVPLEEEALALQSEIAEEALASESEVSEADEAQADPYLSEPEVEMAAAKFAEAVIACSYQALPATLDKWVEEGNGLTRGEVIIALRNLRKRQMHARALQVSKWLQAEKFFTFNENDYSNILDLVARVHNIYRAEKYFETIPLEMRGNKVYGTLLSHWARTRDIKKTEEFFNKMKDAGVSLEVFDYNSLLALYKLTDRRKISNVLEMMERENVEYDAFTYRILIDAKGWVGDIVGMEKVVESMKAKGIQADHLTLAMLARQYTHVGNTQKAVALMKELENNGTAKDERYVLRILLPLYADVGEVSEVERIWNAFESFPKMFMSEYIAGIQAWGKLGKIEKAEIIFDKLLKSGTKIGSPKAYNALLDVYADHHLLLKGKELVKRMSDNGIKIDPNTWDALVKLFVKSGNLEKADAALFKFCSQKYVKPQFGTFITVLKKYAEMGDIANAEKIFDGLTSIGYGGRLQTYEFLLQAYIKAKTPAYGFKERMLAAKLYPNKRISDLLLQVDAFKKNALKKDHISEILD